MASNDNLHRALKNKNDEFYTHYEDVENECKNYKSFFENKVIYLNCDNEHSAFWKYFCNNFQELKLKQLIATHIEDFTSYIVSTKNGTDIFYIDLKQNGDFFSRECQICLQLSDIVVTNPPFSLFRAWVQCIINSNKKFLLIGNENSCISTEIFPLMKSRQIVTGFNKVHSFTTPDGTEKEFGNIHWFTNLPIEKNIPKLTLTRTYDPAVNESYDNYKAINVDRVEWIPKDYYGIMGVPIGFLLNKWNPDQFDVLGIAAGNSYVNHLYYNVPYEHDNKDRGGAALINGKLKYSRIFIQRKNKDVL